MIPQGLPDEDSSGGSSQPRPFFSIGFEMGEREMTPPSAILQMNAPSDDVSLVQFVDEVHLDRSVV